MDATHGRPFKAMASFKGGPNPDAPPVSKPVSTSYIKAIPVR
jgi:hypothetical protein